MATVRIQPVERKTTQSGRARAGQWLLEFERTQPQRPDPLTGWNGSGDTRTQVRLLFDSAEEAVDYARRRGLDYHLVQRTPVELKIQAYADNFR